MLYIKTTTAAKRLNLPSAKHLSAESAGLLPSTSLKQVFELNWTDAGLFHRADTSQNGLRYTYHHFKRLYHDEIKANTDVQDTIMQICHEIEAGQDIILTVAEVRKFPNSIRRMLVELFYEVGLTDAQIQTDHGLRASMTQAMDVLSTKPAVNATIQYEYRDANGNTMQNIVTLIGEISDQQIAEILACCKNGREFVPNGVALPLTRPSAYNAEKDHPWARFLDPSISFQNIETIHGQEYTIDDLVARFKLEAPHWDAVAAERKRREDNLHRWP